MSSDNASSQLKDCDPRPHLNLVFIGHVDAGKSTTCGNIMYLSGLVDNRTIEKFEREAKDKNRESWFLAYIMDTNEEERAKGITVEVGRAHFETPNRRFTILDAPGHKNYVPNMISGAAQADIGVLMISARKGEFETGFDKGGQTREHAMLAKTLGVNKLIITVNKMDDPTVNWSKERYDQIVEKLTPFLKGCGFNVKSEDDVFFLPISGLKGDNLKEGPKSPGSDWYKGPTLFQVLDNANPPYRDPEAPLRIPIVDGYRDMGTIAMGKIEQGKAQPGQQCMLLPNKTVTEIQSVYIEDDEYKYANPGEDIKLKLKNVDEDQVQKGFVLSAIDHPCPVVQKFQAQLVITDLLEHKPIITIGYTAVLHVHTAIEECTITKLIECVDKQKKTKQKRPRFAKTGQMLLCVIETTNRICVDTFKRTPQLGRFTLRDEGKTIAIGKIVELPKSVTEGIA
ncbi:eukaryotic peptide chain release factor GTP-binding subunit, putative [Perkinsus marinus ATCC 50983]|uniref:Eukaryotic peptide chain release factor GTP-binding subunit, putative n=1 Tax=Perkinsus marinus (strain ATCC 50983 / TXsc) TaxID=423536 RepID=C5KJB7_PERM5|nr:eukaryotic peptide chain release factor GTP-binding subunit, putative [Perkinsus marinus ATCC 50983]EER15419.1 eukaryotic peptide chain release factor GTP-binding subunit, putative [Perkinsus marinus ATCC 50983]|eukprot:XP_002783623.1 eukaryotic peptide chain release factor GTP-binding subunit, putative [Perkinsus marinus ATCC 50983]